MMYLRRADLELSNEDLRQFIIDTLPAEGEAARYPR
jgi:hypothetical protein